MGETLTPSRHLRTVLILGLACANILVIALSAHTLYRSRSQHELFAQTQTRNVARALDQNISGSIEKIDLTLGTVTDELERQLTGKGIEVQAMDAFLDRHAKRLPEILALRVVNAHGIAILGRGRSEANGVDWSERSYFIYHRDHPDAALHFSKPFMANIGKRYIVTFTRRFNYPDGRFAGVAIAPIPVEYFTQLLSRFDLGRNGSIILRDSDLGLISRYPPIPEKPAGQIGNSDVSEIGRRLSASLVKEVSYHAPAGSDGMERVYTLRRLQDAPMLVGASTAGADYLAQWRNEAYQTGAMALGFLLLSLASGGLLLRQYGIAAKHQQILRQSEERLRTIIDNANAVIFMKDAQGRYLLVNKLFERLFHMTDAQLQGKTDFDVFAHDRAKAFIENDQTVLRSGQPLEIEELVPQDDGPHTYISVKFPLRNTSGEIYAVCGIATDITERKRAEIALIGSEDKFRKAFYVNPDSININRLEDGMYVSINRGFTATMGYTEDEIIGHSSLEFNIWDDPEDRARMVRGIEQDGMVANLEARFRAKDGTILYGLMSAARIEIDGVPHVISITRDISERKKADEARAQLEAQLRESQKMEALGTLAGGVAHDFNNIVAAILGNVELARQDIAPTHAARQSLEEIRNASLRAKALVQQILSFGRRGVIERKVISLAPIVEESMRLLRATLPAGVSLVAECEPGAPLILADTTQIEQVLINLCNNAWQSVQSQARPGAIAVRLKAYERAPGQALEPGFVLVSGEMQPGRYVCLTVEDNGTGMAEETLARIFEPFFTTKPVGKGTGLGLAVVHGIAQEHGASIEVRSIPGEGSTFRVYFPAVYEFEHAAHMQGANAAPPHGQGKHVLYVDDDEAIVFLMTRLLERQGYRVSGYTDAAAALASVRANPVQFDLAVTDYNMPGMSGLELARALKEIVADLPIAMASGYLTDELREQAPAAGVSELIYKPNTIEELCLAVARLAQTTKLIAKSS